MYLIAKVQSLIPHMFSLRSKLNLILNVEFILKIYYILYTNFYCHRDPEPENEIAIQGQMHYFRSDYWWKLYNDTYDYITSIREVVFDNTNLICDAEDRFLRCLHHKFYRYNVPVSDACNIWTISSLPFPLCDNIEFKRNKPTVVLIHGLLSGLAYWAMNLDHLVDLGFDVFAFDLPGFARSTRIDFSDDSDETEAIFIEIIEKWRETLGIKSMFIIGHSFGGYISTAYSLSYPQHTHHLVLVDPWGFPDVREEVTTVLEYKQGSFIPSPLSALPIWMRVLVMIMMPFSPFSFLRLAGKHLGPKIIHILRPDMTRRYSRIFGDDDTFTVPNYIYHTNKLNPTGENAFRSMSLPLAWAKNPLIKRISKLNNNVNISFIYGSRSWIDFQTGFEVKNILSENEVNVYVIDGAGHHLFADEPHKFNSLISHIIGEDTCHGEICSPQDDSSSLLIKDISMK